MYLMTRVQRNLLKFEFCSFEENRYNVAKSVSDGNLISASNSEMFDANPTH